MEHPHAALPGGDSDNLPTSGCSGRNTAMGGSEQLEIERGKKRNRGRQTVRRGWRPPCLRPATEAATTAAASGFGT